MRVTSFCDVTLWCRFWLCVSGRRTHLNTPSFGNGSTPLYYTQTGNDNTGPWKRILLRHFFQLYILLSLNIMCVFALRRYDGLKPQDLDILWAIFAFFSEKRSLSNCRYCADRAQSLPARAIPHIWLTLLFQITSKSVHFRRSYCRTREDRFRPVKYFQYRLFEFIISCEKTRRLLHMELE